MAEQELKTKLIARNDTAANWAASDPVLLRGELGVETDTGKVKYGDGVKAWSALPYAVPMAADVSLAPIDGMAATTVQEAVAENFQSVVDGKKLLEATVSDKGGTVEKAGSVATFAELQVGIAGISACGGNECVITYENYNPISASERISFTPLSNSRHSLAATTMGNKAIFAGGSSGNKFMADIDAYMENGVKSSLTPLSEGKKELGATSIEGKAIIAGGIFSGSSSSIVEVYTEGGSKTTFSPLTQARCALCAASVSGKAIFAGGRTFGNPMIYMSDVDVYSSEGIKTSFTALSECKQNMAATVLGDKVIFGGGVSSNKVITTVEAYTAEGVKTFLPELSNAKYLFCACTVGSVAIFAGGYSGSAYLSDAEAYREDATKFSLTSLTQTKYSLAATNVSKKAIFAGGSNGTALSTVEAYIENGTKFILSSLPKARYRLAASTVGNKAIFAGGSINQSEFSDVDAYTETDVVSLKVLGGGIYNFENEEVAVPGNLTEPRFETVNVQKPVNGYIKYKGMIISG